MNSHVEYQTKLSDFLEQFKELHLRFICEISKSKPNHKIIENILQCLVETIHVINHVTVVCKWETTVKYDNMTMKRD